jgi:chromosome segregation ATPase
MTNEMLVFLSGMAAAFTAGGAVAYLLARRPSGPPPDIEGQWLAEIAELRTTGDRQRGAVAAAEAAAAAATAELEHLRENSASLEHQVGSYLKQYAVAKDTLKKEILQKNALRTELAATQAEVEALKARVMELQLERDATGNRRVLAR